MKKLKKLVAVLIATALTIIIAGCAAPQIEKKAPPTVAEEPFKEYSLSEAQKFSEEALALAYGNPFRGDPYIAAIELMKQRAVSVEGLSVNILTPQDGEAVTGKVMVRAAVTVGGPPVQSVSFYVDGYLRDKTNKTPYEFEWDTAKEAFTSHKLKVVAFDGKNEASDEITVYCAISGGIALEGADYSKKSGYVSSVKYLEPEKDRYVRGVVAKGSSSLIYVFSPPRSFSYIQGKLTLNGFVLAGEQPEVYVYNWGSLKYEKEVVDYRSGEVIGSVVGSNFGFPYFQPGSNQVLVKVVVPAGSTYQVESLNLSYMYVRDKVRPDINGVFTQAYLSSSGTKTKARFIFNLSEDAFATLSLYKSSGAKIASYRKAFGSGYNWFEWEVPRAVSISNLRYKITAEDSAGNTRSTSLKTFKPLTPDPYQYLTKGPAVSPEGVPFVLPFDTGEAKEEVSVWNFVAHNGNVQKVKYYGKPDFRATLVGPYQSWSSVIYAFRAQKITPFEYAWFKPSFEVEEIYMASELKPVFKLYNYVTNQYDYNLYNPILARDAFSSLDKKIYTDPWTSGNEIPWYYIEPGTGLVRIKFEVPPRSIALIKDKVRIEYRCSPDSGKPGIESGTLEMKDVKSGDGKVEFRYHLTENAFVTIRVETASGSLIRSTRWGDNKGFAYHYFWVPPEYYGKKARVKLYLKDPAGNTSSTGYRYFTFPKSP